MDLTELGFEDVDWIDPVEEEVQWLIWEEIQIETFAASWLGGQSS